MKCKALLGEIIKEGVHKGTMFKAIAWRGNFADQEITLQAVGRVRAKALGKEGAGPHGCRYGWRLWLQGGRQKLGV